jgi:hypothetical protein
MGLAVLLACVAASGSARALDCPCTWEAVICDADAVAEVEMHLATRAKPDRLEVRRVIWNRTKQRIRARYGLPNIPHVTNTRQLLVHYLQADRLERPHVRPEERPDEWEVLFRRALERGSYRSIVFLRYSQKAPWSGGGVAYLSNVNWLDHPQHAEWWAKIQPYLRERIDADARGEKPAFCARTERAESQIQM